MAQTLTQRFFAWYERHYRVAVTITTLLFLLQVVHLYWLFAHVISLRLLGVSYFTPNAFWQTVIILIDYTEVPALLSTTLLYVHEFRKGIRTKAVLFLILLNSQWLHLFWITDEFVLDTFQGTANQTILPAWLAWIAILIDYLELPVIVDTIFKTVRSWSKGEKVTIG